MKYNIHLFFQYLGSTLVEKLNGVESTKDSINEMKVSVELCDCGRLCDCGGLYDCGRSCECEESYKWRQICFLLRFYDFMRSDVFW